METKNKPWIQPELTPEAANPPPEPQKKDPTAGKWNVVPEVIPPTEEDHHVETTEERREKHTHGGY